MPSTSVCDRLLRLAVRDHIEVRISSPLPARGSGFAPRLLFSLHDCGRINHRMQGWWLSLKMWLLSPLASEDLL